jgi:hypothetical protein
MADAPVSKVEIRDFPGLVLQSDPHDTPVGAALEQVNVTSSAQARLRVRFGYREVKFEEQ